MAPPPARCPCSSTPAPDASVSTSAPVRESDTFYFQDTGLTTPRQGGNTIDLFVGLRYADGTDANEIPDYRQLLALATTFLTPSDALPANVSWETLATTMAPALKASGPMSGVTVQIRVHPKCSSPADKRGVWRSAVHTVGDIDPMDYVPGPVEVCPAR